MGLIDATKAMKSIDEIVCSMSVCMNSDYCHGMTAMKDAALHAIENQPTVDVVPVVRCGKCKWWKKYRNGNDWGLCEKHDIDHPCNCEWFCADGERRSDEDQHIYD